MSWDGSMERSARDLARLAQGRNRTADRMAEIAAAFEKKTRMRRFTWCRAEHATYEDKRWRLVARMAAAPLHLVEAFITRLDLYASANMPRGSLDGFSIAGLAAFWNLPAEDMLARIYAALEHPDIGWIDGDHLATFWTRNPDTDDLTGTVRSQRSRAFAKAMKTLRAMAAGGLIDSFERDRREVALYALRDRGARGLLTWPEQQQQLRALLSTEAACNGVAAVTAVAVTAISDPSLIEEAVENSATGASIAAAGLSEGQAAAPVERSTGSGDNAGGEQQGLGDGIADNALADKAPTDKDLADEGAAELWLATEGRRLVVERLTVVPLKAATLLERWRSRAGGSHGALAGIVAGVAAKAKTAAHFDLAIGEGCNRHRKMIEEGPTLAMGPAGAKAIATKNIATKPIGPKANIAADLSGSLAESIERLRKAVNDG